VGSVDGKEVVVKLEESDRNLVQFIFNSSYFLPVGTTLPGLLTDCYDYVGNGVTCGRIPNVCNDLYGKLVCKRFCGICSKNNNNNTNHVPVTRAGSMS
jgi:hypothetical protein